MHTLGAEGASALSAAGPPPAQGRKVAKGPIPRTAHLVQRMSRRASLMLKSPDPGRPQPGFNCCKLSFNSPSARPEQGSLADEHTRGHAANPTDQVNQSQHAPSLGWRHLVASGKQELCGLQSNSCPQEQPSQPPAAEQPCICQVARRGLGRYLRVSQGLQCSVDSSARTPRACSMRAGTRYEQLTCSCPPPPRAGGPAGGWGGI